MRPPIPYHDHLEQLSPHEPHIHKRLAREFHKIISATHRDLGHAERGVHAKSHALLEGTIHIHSNLSPELAQGLFSHPADYPVTLRISSVPGDPLPDSVSGPRGFALKIMNIQGELLPDNHGCPVQDFLFVNGPSFAATDSQEFLRTLRILSPTTNRFETAKITLSRLLRALQAKLIQYGRPSSTLDVLGGYQPTWPLADRFFSQVPLRYGNYIAKFDVVPQSENLLKRHHQHLDIDHHPLAMRRALKEVFSHEDAQWTLRVQLCRDLKDNPIEDAKTIWPEKNNPFLPVATISIPAQESWNTEKSQQFEDTLSYSPWHGLTAHRPLGNIMRARRALYPFSATLRTRLNGCPLAFMHKR